MVQVPLTGTKWMTANQILASDLERASLFTFDQLAANITRNNNGFLLTLLIKTIYQQSTNKLFTAAILDFEVDLGKKYTAFSL